MRLVIDGRGLAQSIAWGEITSALGTELMKRSPKSVIVSTPPYFNVSRARRQQFIRELADKLEPVAKCCTREEEVRIGRYMYTVGPVEGSGCVTFACSPVGGTFDPGCQPLPALRKKLLDKNRQLCVAGHERVVLIVGWDETIRTEDVREAISNIDFSCLPNIDRVYFESGLERIHLVYDSLKMLYALKGGSGQ